MKYFEIFSVPKQSGSSEKLSKLSLGLRVLFARPLQIFMHLELFKVGD